MKNTIDEILKKYENEHKESIESILTATDINRLIEIASDNTPGDHNMIMLNAIMDGIRIGYMIGCEQTTEKSYRRTK